MIHIHRSAVEISPFCNARCRTYVYLLQYIYIYYKLGVLNTTAQTSNSFEKCIDKYLPRISTIELKSSGFSCACGLGISSWALLWGVHRILHIGPSK